MQKLSAVLVAIFFWGCNPSVRPINYGLDSCDYCKMSIADARFAAEIVTEKGKIFTYDAIECMVHALDDFETQEFAAMVVMDYNNPDEWIAANEGVFVIDSKIQSPMGAGLACFTNESEAMAALQISKDSLLSWEAIRTKDLTFED